MDSSIGALMFARYAYPPNERGYCGPADARTLLEYAHSGAVDPGLGALAKQFSGAWPYLTFIAGQLGVADPLDRRVVEAYWLGTDDLKRIDMTGFGNELFDRFYKRAGRGWGHLAETVPAGAVPSHAFHVFGVYPWVGLLGSDHGEHPLHILDRCRIRWGRVLSVSGEVAVVASRPLLWDGRRLSLGSPGAESVTLSVDGTGLVRRVEPGDWLALHWDWICDRLDERQLASLQASTAHQLAITNHELTQPGRAAILET